MYSTKEEIEALENNEISVVEGSVESKNPGTSGTVEKIPDLGFLKSARTFVDREIDNNHWIILPNGQISYEGKNVELDIAVDTLYLNFSDDYSVLKKKERQGIRLQTRDSLRMALDEKIRFVRSDALESLKKDLSYDPSCVQELEQFQIALTGEKDELALAVLKHFVWQVRRKLFGLQVRDHLMVVLFGPQGSGKSRAIESLLSPINSLVLPTTIFDVVDERFQPMLSKHYVAFIDEMAGASKTDIEKLKRIVTAGSVKVRKLCTNNSIDVSQDCTLLGASNKELCQIIKDPTGMRRFFELSTLPRIDWNAINRINYKCLWKSVDENNEEGFLENVRSKLLDHQKGIVARDPVEEFIEEFNLSATDKNSEWITTKDLFKYYKYWARESGFLFQLDKISFARKFRSKGFQKDQLKEKGSNARGFYINPGNTLSELKFIENSDLY